MQRDGVLLTTVPVKPRRSLNFGNKKPGDVRFLAEEFRWALNIPDSTRVIFCEAVLAPSVVMNGDAERCADQAIKGIALILTTETEVSKENRYSVIPHESLDIASPVMDSQGDSYWADYFEAGWKEYNHHLPVVLVDDYIKLAEWFEMGTINRPRWGEEAGEALGRFFGCADSTLKIAEGRSELTWYLYPVRIPKDGGPLKPPSPEESLVLAEAIEMTGKKLKLTQKQPDMAYITEIESTGCVSRLVHSFFSALITIANKEGKPTPTLRCALKRLWRIAEKVDPQVIADVEDLYAFYGDDLLIENFVRVYEERKKRNSPG